jgi:hypothetical protein
MDLATGRLAPAGGLLASDMGSIQQAARQPGGGLGGGPSRVVEPSNDWSSSLDNTDYYFCDRFCITLFTPCTTFAHNAVKLERNRKLWWKAFAQYGICPCCTHFLFRRRLRREFQLGNSAPPKRRNIPQELRPQAALTRTNASSNDVHEVMQVLGTNPPKNQLQFHEPCSDLFAVSCCYCCALIQESRELDVRNFSPPPRMQRKNSLFRNTATPFTQAMERDMAPDAAAGELCCNLHSVQHLPQIC